MRWIRLLLAAPDMLAALEAQEKADAHWENCDECQDSTTVGWCETGLALIQRAHDLRGAAIAKAKGEVDKR